jgi:hypothetical protein
MQKHEKHSENQQFTLKSIKMQCYGMEWGKAVEGHRSPKRWRAD